MNILVTGGAGFIGSHLVDRLLMIGHKVKVLDSLEKQVHLGRKPEFLNKEAEYIFSRVGDATALKNALKDAEIIFHEAAVVGVGQSMYQLKSYIKKNTYDTAVLLDYLVNHKNKVQKLIVASSMSIYGEGSYKCKKCGFVYPSLREDAQLQRKEWEVYCPSCDSVVLPYPTNESKPLLPNSIYAIAKRDQEEMCLVIGKAYKIPVVALRYFNVYGPRQSLNNPYTGVVAIFSSRIKNNHAPEIFEDGKQSRDFIYVSDIVEANILAMNSKKADYGVFNVGTGRAISILEIAETLIKLYKSSLSPLVLNRFRSGDIRYCFADVTSIKDKLGFSCKISFEEGIKKLADWAESVKAIDLSKKAKGELQKKALVI